MDIVALLQVFFAAMTPVGELRISIPIGIHILDLPWYQVLPISIIGNILPVLILVPTLHISAVWLRKHPSFLTKLLDWRATSLLNAHVNHFAKYGSIFLIVLVAIPIPMTGAWTGSLASWAFGIPAQTRSRSGGLISVTPAMIYLKRNEGTLGSITSRE